MITRKNKRFNIPTDKVIISHGGSEVEIQSIEIYEPGSTTGQEVYPPPANYLDIAAPYHDNPQNGWVETLIEERQYPVALINVNSNEFKSFPLELVVTPKPETAGWKLDSPTGVDLGVYTDQVFYGVQRLDFSSLPDLDIIPSEKHQCIRVVPLKGSAEPCEYWFKQVAKEIVIVENIAEWQFTNNLNDSTTGGTYAFQNINSGSITKDATYASAYLPADYALIGIYDKDADDAAIEPTTYRANIKELLDPDWRNKGMSISALAKISDSLKIGFWDNRTDNEYAQENFAFSCSFGNTSITGPKASFTRPTTLYRDYRNQWQNITLTVENMKDLESRDDITINNLYSQADVDYTSLTYTQQQAIWNVVYRSNNVNYEEVVYSTNHISHIQSNLDAANLGTLKEYQGQLYKLYLNGTLIREMVKITTLKNINDNILAGTDVYPGADINDPEGGYISLIIDNNPLYQYETSRTEISRFSVYNGTLQPDAIKTLVASENLEEFEFASQQGEENVLNPRYRDPAALPDWSKLIAKTWVIDDRTIAFGIDPLEFYRNQMLIDFPNFGAVDENFINGFMPDWGREWYWKYTYYDLKSRYDPMLIDDLDDAVNTISITNVSDQQSRSFSLKGRHSYIMSNFFGPDYYLGETNVVCNSTLMMGQYAYLTLDTPLTAGDSIDITFNGVSANITYDRNTRSEAIKVNQVGYPSDDTVKYAYIGRWLGLDADNPDWVDRAYDPSIRPDWTGEFHIVDANDPVGTPLFTGIAVQTGDEADDKIFNVVDGTLIQQYTGEKVWQLDFTDFNTVGEYQVHVPGLGYSWKFKIGNESAKWQFFCHMRGLWHHRSGDPNLTSDYTAWPMPYTIEETFGSNTSAHEMDIENAYKNGEIVDSTGNTFEAVYGKHFPSHAMSADGVRYRNGKGAWRDAADKDSRTMHIRITNDLADLYISQPNTFHDGQLNFHTSGNGIPDILDEAEWGVERWRRMQDPVTGGVAMWAEAIEHESYKGLRSDMKYYMAARNCADSLSFAKAAAKLSRALLIANTPESRSKASIWATAAIKAFEFGSNPDNAAKTSWKDKNNPSNTWFYNEDYDARAKIYVYMAAAAMLALTGDGKYTKFMTDEYFDIWYPHAALNWGISVSAHGCSELMGAVEVYVPDHAAKYQAAIRWWADTWADHLLPNTPYYDPIFRVPDTGINRNNPGLDIYAGAISRGMQYAFANFTQYGGGHIDGKGDPISHMYMWTREKKYRNALQRLLDNNNGANALGHTNTTGLGHVNPVWGLQGQQLAECRDGVQAEPIPGISFYNWWNPAGGLSHAVGVNVASWQHNVPPRNDFKFYTHDFTTCLTGGYRAKYGAKQPSVDGAANVANFTRVAFPKWRIRLEGAAAWYPISGEYTVWETMYKKAIYSALFLEEGLNAPDPTWTKTKKLYRSEVEGWFYLG